MSHFQGWTGFPFLTNPAWLLQQFRGGDRKVLNMLYHHFFPSLCFFARQLTGDDAIAEQIAENSLKNLWTQRSGIEDLGSVKNFLYLNTYQQCFRFIKTVQKNSNRVKSPEEEYLQQKEKALIAVIRAELFSAIEEMPDAREWLKKQILSLKAPDEDHCHSLQQENDKHYRPI